MNDIRFALRQLRKSPGFTVVAVLTLALGIGANSAIFSVINAVLLRPLPYPDAERIVYINEADAEQPSISVSWPNFVDWKRESTVFEELAITRRESYNLNGVQSVGAERVSGALVSANFFKVVGLAPQIGRTFTDEEDRVGGPRLAVISDALWLRLFQRDPAVLGRDINLHNQLFTVVGVMAPQMNAPSDVDVWLPITRRSANPGWQNRGNHPMLFAWAKLKPGVAVEQARAQLKTIAAGLAAKYPESNTGITVAVAPLLENQVGPYRKNLTLLLGAVALVLLIACANLANLLAVRGATRSREFAVRSALGAGRGQIIRQLLIESSVIALLGGAAGLLIAFWGRDAIIALSPATVPRLDEVQVDARVLVFTFALALGTNFLFGLWPARMAANADVQLALKSGGHGSSDSVAARRTRNSLVIGEIALTLVLLTSAALVLKSFARAQSLSLGFEPRGLLSVRMDLPYMVYTDKQKIANVSERLLERVRTLPGVTDAALASNPPLIGSWQGAFQREGKPAPPQGQEPSAETNVVAGDYFRTLQASLLRGRSFNEQDTATSPEVVVIDQSLAERWFAGEDPIGQRLRIDTGEGDSGARPFEIIGIAAPVKGRAFDDVVSLPAVYFTQRQVERTSYALLVRSNVAPAALERSIRDAVASLDPTQPIYEVRPMLDRVQETWAASRFMTVLLMIFAGLALLLAMIGLYGVLAFNVLRRTREIGVRLAVGAQPAHILALILGQGMRLLVIGLSLGALGAFASSRLLHSFLFEVNAADPAIYLTVSLLLAFAAAIACWLPARRASRVNPMITLRAE